MYFIDTRQPKILSAAPVYDIFSNVIRFFQIIGVSLTHYNMVANLSQLSHPEVLIEGLRTLDNQETTVAVLPFFHIYAMNCIMTFGLRLGGKLVTVPRFEPEMYISCLGFLSAERNVPEI